MLQTHRFQYCLKTIFLLFLIVGNLKLVHSQTIGGSFGIFQTSSGTQLIQTIGQPYSNFYKSQIAKTVIHQGQILPDIFNTTSVNSMNGVIQVFPNPVLDELNIQSMGNFSILKLEILDVQSKRVSFIQEKISNDFQRVLISDLSEGVYILRVTDDLGNVKGYKFTKINQ